MHRNTSGFTKSSSKSKNRQNQNGFRVLIKNRISHQIVKCDDKKISMATQIEELTSSLNQPNQSTLPKQLKDFIKNMKPRQQIDLKEEDIPQKTNRKSIDRNSVASRSTVRSQVSSMLKNTIKSNIKQLPTIEELEKKLDNIISEKLTKLVKTQGLSGLQKIKFADQFENNIKELVSNLQLLKENDYDQQSNSQDIKNITKKINFLEKVIAESATESDLLKRFYFARKSQKVPKQSLINEKNFSLFKSASILQRLSSSLCLDKNINRSINLQTTSNACYKKPSKADYVVEKPNKPRYTLNRQPISRSTYSSQFFNYGSLVHYKHKQPNTNICNNISMVNCKTTYSHDFQSPIHKTENIANKKDLDCYHDKFKNPNISFMKHSQKNQTQLIKKSKKYEYKPKQQNKVKTQNNNGESFQHKVRDLLKKSFMSETNRQFQLSKEAPIQSIIKDKNLNTLKNVYRNYLRS